MEIKVSTSWVAFLQSPSLRVAFLRSQMFKVANIQFSRQNTEQPCYLPMEPGNIVLLAPKHGLPPSNPASIYLLS